MIRAIKRLSNNQKIQIKTLKEAGLSLAKIANQLVLAKGTVSSFLSRSAKASKKTNKNPVGRKPKWSSKHSNRLSRMVIKEREGRFASSDAITEQFNLGLEVPFSSRTIRTKLNKIGLKSYWAASKPNISEKQAKKRLSWCKAYRNWTSEQFMNVIWSDETSIKLGYQFKCRVRRKANEKFHKDCMQKTFKSRWVSRMYWGCFMGNVLGPIVKVKGNLNSNGYIELLESNFLQFYDGNKQWEDILGGVDKDRIFMQDNAPCHSSRKTKEWLAEKGIMVMEWPAQSPDLNPIENLWYLLKKMIAARHPKNIEELDLCVVKCWSEIKVEILEKLVMSLPSRIKKAIAVKGYNIRY
jgi:transposase/arsenate reductase-like glutaredoxin family protein